MVYLSHKISIDRVLLNQLKSNDALHLLVKQLSVESENTGHQGGNGVRNLIIGMLSKPAVA